MGKHFVPWWAKSTPIDPTRVAVDRIASRLERLEELMHEMRVDIVALSKQLPPPSGATSKR